jgi:DNA-binding transcriptional LysR family regulator
MASNRSFGKHITEHAAVSDSRFGKRCIERGDVGELPFDGIGATASNAIGSDLQYEGTVRILLTHPELAYSGMSLILPRRRRRGPMIRQSLQDLRQRVEQEYRS